MNWSIVYKDIKAIKKAVSKLRASTQVCFDQAISDLRQQGPRPQGWNVKPLKGYPVGFMRLKLDHRHRMIYSVYENILTIEIIEVATRENIYK